MEEVLEVARHDIHVLLWELPTENIGEAGEEPVRALMSGRFRSFGRPVARVTWM